MKWHKEDSILATDSERDYLPATIENDGLGNLGEGDYKTPRILLLQGLSPQVQNFPGAARAGHFWHTGMNMSLGDEFVFVPCTANKKVVLWRPRWDQGGGILAFSRDAVNWEFGGNTRHTVALDKSGRHTAEWDTGKNVASSGLTEWGSFDPEDDSSPPAAQEVYEYICYLPNSPELSPVLLGVGRTGLPNARNFNTTLRSWRMGGKPIFSLAVTCFAEEKSANGNNWFVHHFKPMGKVNEKLYVVTKEISDRYKDFVAKDYETQQDEGTAPVDELKY
jgi:hypothetical protein